MLRKAAWVFLLVLATPVLRSASASPLSSSDEKLLPVAALSGSGTTVEWQPRVEGYDRLLLTVAGPKELLLHREFKAGENPTLRLVDKAGRPWPDGDYTYELRRVAKVARGAAEVAASKGSPDLQIGALSVRDGQLVLSEFPEPDGPAAEIAPWDREAALQRTLVAAPLIVQGNACIGADCLTTETPFDLLLKRDQPSITFQDTFGVVTGDRDWQLIVDENGTGNNFTLKDVDTGNRPFVVESDAPTSSLYVRSNGSIGLGTFPQNKLHVYGTGGTTKAFVQEASGTNAFRELLELRNNGGTFMIFKDSSLTQRWSAGTLGSSFILDEQAHAGVEFTLTNTGNLTVLGTVTPGSSREIKHGFSPVDPRGMLDRVVALPITSWNYNADPNVRHIGPMAEDFYSAFQVGADDKGISVTDSAGVAFAAIQGLYSLVAEKDSKIAEVQSENSDLARRNRELDERLTRLEAKLSALDRSNAAALPVQ